MPVGQPITPAKLVGQDTMLLSTGRIVRTTTLRGGDLRRFKSRIPASRSSGVQASESATVAAQAAV